MSQISNKFYTKDFLHENECIKKIFYKKRPLLVKLRNKPHYSCNLLYKNIIHTSFVLPNIVCDKEDKTNIIKPSNKFLSIIDNIEYSYKRYNSCTEVDDVISKLKNKFEHINIYMHKTNSVMQFQNLIDFLLKKNKFISHNDMCKLSQYLCDFAIPETNKKWLYTNRVNNNLNEATVFLIKKYLNFNFYIELVAFNLSYLTCIKLLTQNINDIFINLFLTIKNCYTQISIPIYILCYNNSYIIENTFSALYSKMNYFKYIDHNLNIIDDKINIIKNTKFLSLI